MFPRFLTKKNLLQKFDKEANREAEAAQAKRNAEVQIEEPVVNVTQKKRKRPTPQLETPDPTSNVVAPPIPPRNTKLPGGQPKPAGIVFAATYANSAILGKTLGALETFTASYDLVFNADGLSISFIDKSHILMVSMRVPAASFVRYVGLTQQAIKFAVMSKTINVYSRDCTSDHTLTFMYDQCGLATEPLHLRLYPGDGKVTSGQIDDKKLPPFDLDELACAPTEPYQYRVRMSAKLFRKNLVSLVKESGTLRLMLSKDALEMAALTDENQEARVKHVPVKQCDDDDDEKCCEIQRIGDPNSRIAMEQLRDYRMSAVYLESATSFGALSWCKDVIIRMGVTRRQSDGPPRYDAEPLHLYFPVKPNSGGAFDVEVWVAPTINEE